MHFEHSTTPFLTFAPIANVIFYRSKTCVLLFLDNFIAMKRTRRFHFTESHQNQIKLDFSPFFSWRKKEQNLTMEKKNTHTRRKTMAFHMQPRFVSSHPLHKRNAFDDRKRKKWSKCWFGEENDNLSAGAEPQNRKKRMSNEIKMT